MNKPTIEQLEELEKDRQKMEDLLSPYACKNKQSVREYASKLYDNEIIRSQFSVDVDKIIHSQFYNRGSDKTQVFSFYKNDDITRRTSHVQLVSRIARRIGAALRLNLDLIEAIAIGHDIGHTPFGHKGEKYLSELYHADTGRYFNHNVHSVRALQRISGCNLTLQTLDGILCHCGEKVNEKYEPHDMLDFEEFNRILDACYIDQSTIGKLRPCTLEGCVVRISDMIAYLGKDRQDAIRLGIQNDFQSTSIGKSNSELLQNVVDDIIANSIGRPYLSLSADVYDEMVTWQRENNEKIYQRPEMTEQYENIVRPMMKKMYDLFLNDLYKENTASLIYKGYLNLYVGTFYKRDNGDLSEKRYSDIVVDFIASMTDDYFLEAFHYLFEADELNTKVKFVGYFDNFDKNRFG